MTKLITPAILDDRPLSEDKHAQFQFEAYANTLARIILSRNNKTPLVIGVYGEWGSGKTSLMQIVKGKLEESRNTRGSGGLPSFMSGDDPNAFRPCRTVWFNAWKYGREEELWVSLIHEIGREISKDSDFLKGIEMKLSDLKRNYNWSKAMLSGATQLVTGGRVNLDLEKSRFAENVAFYDEFQTVFDKIIAGYTNRSEGGALIIFIDDLDRCLPSKVVQVLEAIKLFMDRLGCVFVIGADPKIIRLAIQAHYETHGIKEMSAEEYLDKMAQVHFELPPLRPDDVTSYIQSLPGLESFARDYLELVASGIRTNPRRIKMFVNHMEVQWSLLVNMGLDKFPNKQNVTEWLVLNEACPALREEIQKAKGEAHDILGLIQEMKDTSLLEDDLRKKKIKSDERLSKLLDSETVINVLRKGRFEFEKQEIGIYIHLSPAPSLQSREKELIWELDRVLDELTPREKRVLQLRYGLKDGHGRTSEEVGRKFNVSGETIQEIEAKALRKLRHPSRSRRLKAYLGSPRGPDSGEDDLVRAIFGMG